MERIMLDEGYQYGIGAFETIALEREQPVFLEWHMERLERAMRFLGFFHEITQNQVTGWLRENPVFHGALKIMVSQQNVIFSQRRNLYTRMQYRQGFKMEFSQVRRNETSPFVYHKTMNYGDCIFEKRKAAMQGLDEMIFLNTKGEISEGTTTNIFFVKQGKVYTPKKECGLLPGVMRRYVMSETETKESVILPGQLPEFEECFVTNSLLGIMPVRSLAGRVFEVRETADRLRQKYETSVLGFKN